MVKVVDLAKRGYFPKELPPPFSTESFGSAIEKLAGNIPSSFGKSKLTTRPARHSLVRSGALRRQLSVPNPVSFYRLSKLLEDNWADVIVHCQKSAISLSGPKIASADRAVVPKIPFNELPTRRASLRASSRYILQTDITNFYASIYTHSFAWALHTKLKAKSNPKLSTLLGDDLDTAVRNGQDRQSIGIPISPDTSLVLAEILLASVDEEFCRRLEDNQLESNGFRFVDDFEFGFATRSDAETAIAILEAVLAEYELQLNPNKTHVIELPLPAEDTWASELRTFSIATDPQIWGLRRYFDRALEMYTSNRESSVLGYAVQRLRSVVIEEADWKVYQDFLLQCVMVEPSTLPWVVDHLHFYRGKDFPLDLDKISKVFNILINEHGPLNHGSEIVWALWGCLLFKRL